jgi:TatD DNase family protein
MKDPFYFDTPIPTSGLPLFDSHAHLQYPDFDHDRDQVIERAKSAGLTHIVCIGTNQSDSLEAIQLAETHPDYIYATVGNHPYNADQPIEPIENLIHQHSKVIVGIGETGLDYFRSPVPKDIQQESFKAHCQLALKYNLPIIIHLREFKDTYQDAKEILQEYKVKKAIFHCYTGDLKSAEEIWSNGWKTGFGLITTYPKNTELREVYAKCPENLKLHETDCPYLPPADKRGERNEPSYLRILNT